jgi:GGDEF domain-containing protein
MLSRIAGDEFVCLLDEHTREQAIALGASAQDQISSFRHEVRSGQHAQVGLSFGIAEFPTDGGSIDELLSVAALATRQNRMALIAAQAFPHHPTASPAQSVKSGPLALVK